MDDDCGDNSDEPFHECSKHIAVVSYLHYSAPKAEQTALLSFPVVENLLERNIFCKLIAIM